jgi:hypothetical protein
MMSDKRDSYYTICPHCGKEFEDSWEDNSCETPNVSECDACGKLFWQWAEYTVKYCTSKLHPVTDEEPGDES